MPRVEQRGRPRLKIHPNMNTCRKRAYRALVGKPTLKKRKDLHLVIVMYKSKARYSMNKKIKEAIKHWTKVLRSFDVEYFSQKADARMRVKKIEGKNRMDKLINVLRLLKDGQTVDGFTTMRTCKTEHHPTFSGVLTGEELKMPELLELDRSLCITRKQHNGKNK